MFVSIGYELKLLSNFTSPARVDRAVCSSFPLTDVQLPRSPCLRESAYILSSSAFLCFFLIPIVSRELVVIVVCSPENFESFASSITVERLPGLTIGFELWSLIESPTGFFESGALSPWEKVSNCVVPSRTCQEGTMYQRLHEDHSTTPSHIVSRENTCCVSDRQSPPRSLWKKVPPSSWRNHSVSFG